MEILNQEITDHSSDYQNKQKMDQQPNQSIILKISNFLDKHSLKLSSFWQSNHNCASTDDIVAFCKGCGLVLSLHDRIKLKSQVFGDNELIYLDQFTQKIPYWKDKHNEAVSDFLKWKSDQMLEKLQSKHKRRAQSGNSRQKTVIRSISSAKLKPEQKIVNNSMKYLRQFKEKEDLKEKQLKQNIEKNKIDEQYAMLLKMSQLNSINKQRGSRQAYRAYKNAQGVIKVRVFSLNKFQKEISLKEFDTIYKNYKKVNKENKEWACSTIKEGDQLQILKTKNNEKGERQQQLRNLLVSTVNLTNLLKQQIKIFKMKGIYGCQNL